MREAPSFVEAAVFHRRCLQTTCDSESVGLVEDRREHSRCETFALTRWMSCQHPQVPIRICWADSGKGVVVARQTVPRLLTRNRILTAA